MHKHIITVTDIIMMQWQNQSCTENIYNKIPKKKCTDGTPYLAYVVNTSCYIPLSMY